MVRVVSATWTVTVRPAWARPRAIPGQPHVQGLPGNPDLRGDLGHRPARPHRQHSPIPLLDHGHVDQCQPRPPTHAARKRRGAGKPITTPVKHQVGPHCQASSRTGHCATAPHCRIEPYLDRSRRRLRRRWPGVSAGLSLGEARPAHAGPHAGRSDQGGSHVIQTGGSAAVFLVAQLSSSRPPRQWRSLRSRRTRSATPTIDPAATPQDSAPIKEDG